jgi:hypothetical protein
MNLIGCTRDVAAGRMVDMRVPPETGFCLEGHVVSWRTWLRQTSPR